MSSFKGASANAETGSRASHEAASASSPSGFDPARVRDWADERIAWHKLQRDDYRQRGETTGAAMAVEAMLELMELKSFLGREFGVPFNAIAIETEGRDAVEGRGAKHESAGRKASPNLSSEQPQ